MRRLKAWAIRRPRWAWWLAVGGPVGGIVIGCLAPALFLLDSFVGGAWSSDNWWIAPWAALIAGVWGTVGGFASGAVCALTVRALDRRGDRTDGRLDAAIGAAVTTALATPISLMMVTSSISFGLWDVVVWLLIPVGVSATVAALVGTWIFRHAPPSQRVQAVV